MDKQSEIIRYAYSFDCYTFYGFCRQISDIFRIAEILHKTEVYVGEFNPSTVNCLNPFLDKHWRKVIDQCVLLANNASIQQCVSNDGILHTFLKENIRDAFRDWIITYTQSGTVDMMDQITLYKYNPITEIFYLDETYNFIKKQNKGE